MRTTFLTPSSLGCRRARRVTNGTLGNTKSGETKKSSALIEGQNRHSQGQSTGHLEYDGNQPAGSIHPSVLHFHNEEGPDFATNYAESSAAVPVNESAQSEICLAKPPQQHTIDEQIQPVEEDLSPIPGRRDFTTLDPMRTPGTNAGALVPDQNDSMYFCASQMPLSDQRTVGSTTSHIPVLISTASPNKQVSIASMNSSAICRSISEISRMTVL